jgi:polyhydroxyalkanoate synthase
MQAQKQPEIPTLPMQLMLALGTWLSSPSVSACANSGFLPWKVPESLNPAENARLSQAVLEEAKSRANSLLTGVLRYLDTPYTRRVAEPPAIWKCGSARLLDYSAGRAADEVVLFIPSLINRYYILDLDKERSLLRHLAAEGIYTLVLDWGVPGDFEREFDCGDYVTEILLPAIEFLQQTTGKKIILAGYCMGGVLSLAAASLKPDAIKKLTLFATPWNFHCHNFSPFILGDDWQDMIESQINEKKQMAAEFLQSLFYWTAPWAFEQKYRRFAEMRGKAAEEFVALEHWVNDGVPLVANVARECLLDWAQKNQLHSRQWVVDGKKIDPKKIRIPTFVVIPENDHVVPRDCAMPLANSLWQRKVLSPHAGHVSMIVGAEAKKQLWEPLVKWLT